MSPQRDKIKSIKDGYFYACCPYCKTTLTQGKNGTDTYSRCPTCNEYIHIVIKDDSVLTQRKAPE